MGAVSPRPILVKSNSSSPGSVSMASPSATPVPGKLSISKSYVIPPRPKPGRKPSHDVPPSRRKAQNREAQRAFRERKSQAVRALEDQLAKQAEEFEKQQAAMREQIGLLQKQHLRHGSVPQSPTISSAPLPVCKPVSQMPAPQLVLTPYPQTGYYYGSPMSPQPMSPGGLSPGSITSSAMSPGPISSRACSPQAMSPQGLASYQMSQCQTQHSNHQPNSPGSPFGTPVTPADVVGLELLDHVLDQKLPVDQQTSPSKSIRRMSRSSKLSPPESAVVIRTDPPMASHPLDLVNTSWTQPAVPLRRKSKALEMDFTSAFAPRSPRPLSLPSSRQFSISSPQPVVRDRCGFCIDNTPCICAASAAREEGGDIAPDLATLGSPLGFDFGSPLKQQNNRPIENQRSPLDSTSTIAAKGSGECTGNPANCNQCSQDPMLTLFCSAISSKQSSAKPSGFGTYIPAQAAYKTLSRHPGFSSADLGEVVNALLVKSSQIEVNSIAKVLRMLDPR